MEAFTLECQHLAGPDLEVFETIEPDLDQAVRDILAKRPTAVLDFNLRTGEYSRTTHRAGLEGGTIPLEKA